LKNNRISKAMGTGNHDASVGMMLFSLDRAGWHKLVTEPPLKLGKPFVRQPRGDTRVTPEDKQRLAEQRAAEIAKQRADFNATNN
jgi:hypothetical protein